jgi:hypothetical protein
MLPVVHRVSQQRGHALEFNRNADNPAWWVAWADGSAQWFAPEDLVFEGTGHG